MNTLEVRKSLPAVSMTLSVVSHGHGPLLQRLLSDLESCRGLSEALVIVTLNLANEPFDPTDFPGLNIQNHRNAAPAGFGANHNAAFEHCQTRWFVILNPDLRLPDPTCFESLAAVAERIPEAALLAPLITNSEGKPEDAVRFNLGFISLVARAFKWERSHPDTAIPAQKPHKFYWLAGMFLMARADVFRELKGFDERYFLYCEDYDLGARVYNAGHAITQVQSVYAVHDAQRDSHRSVRHLRLHVGSIVKVWTSSAFWRVCAYGWMSRFR